MPAHRPEPKRRKLVSAEVATSVALTWLERVLSRISETLRELTSIPPTWPGHCIWQSPAPLLLVHCKGLFPIARVPSCDKAISLPSCRASATFPVSIAWSSCSLQPPAIFGRGMPEAVAHLAWNVATRPENVMEPEQDPACGCCSSLYTFLQWCCYPCPGHRSGSLNLNSSVRS